jgi:hypothetical protein
MPLWRFYSSPSTFSAEQRQAISNAVTDLYASRGLPKFYVVVLFVDLGPSTTFVGGEEKPNFVRIAVEQIARTMPPDTDDVGMKFRRRWMDMINKVTCTV